MQDLLEAILNEDKPDPEDLFKSLSPEEAWQREGVRQEAYTQALMLALAQNELYVRFAKNLHKVGFPIDKFQAELQEYYDKAIDSLQFRVGHDDFEI